jgi:hypothetical protein
MIHTALANVLDIPLFQNHQFIVIMIVEVGGKCAAIVYGIPVGVGQHIIYDMVFPVADLGILFCLLFDIVRKQFHCVTYVTS